MLEIYYEQMSYEILTEAESYAVRFHCFKAGFMIADRMFYYSTLESTPSPLKECAPVG
jgi:hypothetical protein